MKLIDFTSIGMLRKTIRFLEWVAKYSPEAILEKYGKLGVEYLKEYTPVDSGLTASSWYYEVEKIGDEITLTWGNSNLNEGCNIAILIQYGHGTGSGAYVDGVDYINPALRPIFEDIYTNICKEVSGQ